MLSLFGKSVLERRLSLERDDGVDVVGIVEPNHSVGVVEVSCGEWF